MRWILPPEAPRDDFARVGGGKAKNLAIVSQAGIPVPEWFCLGAHAFDEFVRAHGIENELIAREELDRFANRIEELFESLSLPSEIEKEILEAIAKRGWGDVHLAVRSSGLDEDSAGHSFAGLFSSYLDQKGNDAIFRSIRKCWASAFSERGMRYRIERKIHTGGLRVGVVIQKMLEPECAGVLFTRDPIHPLERDLVVVESVFGLGEGLVGGLLDGDRYWVKRSNRTVRSEVADKESGVFRRAAGGVEQRPLPEAKRKESSLSESQVSAVTELGLRLETLREDEPQDVEWAIENGKVYCLQTRPITSLPPEAFYSADVNGREPNLWDNSNIVESFSGVTSPFTFSFASYVYQSVYRQFAEMMNVPESMLIENEKHFRNMLGLMRGRIYYNLINWYRLLMIFPGSAENAAFMETMMGVKKNLSAENQKAFDFLNNPPRYGFGLKFNLALRSINRFLRSESIIRDFKRVFNLAYNEARTIDFRKMSIPAQLAYYESLQDRILRRWQAPIVNDFLCMIFFGLLKKLTQKWISDGDAGSSLQNDLLCGQGNLESIKPTKTLMEIARRIDEGDRNFRDWFAASSASEVWLALPSRSPEIHRLFLEFLDHYGFRCVNELKLEEKDLHDDPSFVVNAVGGYVRMKAYSIEAMEERERKISLAAEATVLEKIGGPRRALFFWVLKHARLAVRNREDLRFDRTKIYGIIRHLFRAVGANLVELGLLDSEHDIFYLTLEEILAFTEGRHSTNELRSLAISRRAVFDEYRKSPSPPERFVTYGAVGTSLRYPSVLADGDLLKELVPKSNDPSLLFGTPCCPGIVEGVVRVAHELKDTDGMAGEILVTSRTDPGWVPLYPSCSGLVIERGSLLSHSAVVARELGLPTIVGVSGGLMERLKTGQRIRMDAGKGEIRIL